MNGNKIAKTKTNRRTKRTDETTGSLFRLLVASTNVSVAARNGSAKHSLQNDNRNNNWNFDKRKKLLPEVQTAFEHRTDESNITIYKF